MRPRPLLLATLLCASALAGCSGDEPATERVRQGSTVGGWVVHVVEKRAEPAHILHSGEAIDWDTGVVVLLRNESATAPLRLRLAVAGEEAVQAYALPLPPGEVDRVFLSVRLREPSFGAMHALEVESGGESVRIPLDAGRDAPPRRTAEPLAPDAPFRLGPWEARLVEARWSEGRGSWDERLDLVLEVQAAQETQAPPPALRANVGVGWIRGDNASDPWPTQPGEPQRVRAHVTIPTWQRGDVSLAMLVHEDEAVLLRVPPPNGR